MKIKELRQRTPYNQTEIARLIGIPRINYNKYELGQARPDIETLIKIADFHGVSLDYLCEHPYNNQIGYIPDEIKPHVKNLMLLNQSQLDKVGGYIASLIDDNKNIEEQ